MRECAVASLSKLNASERITLINDAQLPLVELRCGDANAVVSLYGGQVLSYQSPRNTILWHNKHMQFNEGNALRSGIPLCWPWFGPAPGTLANHASLPAHGFARTQWWLIESLHESPACVKLHLRLNDNIATRKMWPHAFDLRLIIQLDEVALKLLLRCDNTGTKPIAFAGALHSYFSVNDIEHIGIEGLDKTTYFDQLAREKHTQHDAVQFRTETDRVYQTDRPRVTLCDSIARKKTSITAFGHKDWVVWNPWQKKAETMADIAMAHWRQFVCIESAITNGHAINIAAGKSYSMGLEIHDATV